MKTKNQKLFIALALLALLSTLNSPLSTAFAQGTTAFTYQGQLRDNGTNANGAYTMIFKLYDSSSAGNQVGSAITNTSSLVNGLFTANLDFGAGAFNGSARWLDITITNGGTTQTLSPRVEVLPSPYALYAATAATVINGAIGNPQLATSAVNANNIASGQVVKSLNGLTDAVSLSAGTNVTITPNGNTLQISASGGGGGGGVTVTNTLAAGNNVGLFTNNGIMQISSFVPHIQFFRNVTNANFTVPTNVTRIEVEMWGAGGGGGGGDINGYGGGGGGSGAYAINVFTVTPGTIYQVTAGAGGVGGGPDASGSSGATSSFGALMTATGGSGGQGATSTADGTGGAAGTETGAIFYPSSVGSNGGQGSNPWSGAGGYGGGVWRGSPGTFPGPAGGGSGPGGGGGGGGGAGGSGNSGNTGLVFVYY